MGPSIATVRSLCTSHLSPSTSQQDCSSYPSSSCNVTRLSSSSSRNTLVMPRTQDRKPHPSRKRMAAFAVLVDPQIKSRSSTLKGIVPVSSQEEYIQSRVTDSLLLEELVSNSGFQTKFDDIAVSPALDTSSADSGNTSEVLGLSDTDLASNLKHRIWVAIGGIAMTGMMTKALFACQSSEDFLQVAVGAVAGFLLSDLGTGFYHWGVDNYGDERTPFFGGQIDAFQGHHQRPWTITKREFCNNIHAIARPAGLFLTPFLVLPSHPFADSFLSVFLCSVVMSQQFHAWSHMKKSQLPTPVVILQDAGILIGRKVHGAHHKPPYDVNYCIVSGLWNPALEKSKFFKHMERFIYAKWGVAPRAWSETSEEWLQTGNYFEDGSEIESSS